MSDNVGKNMIVAGSGIPMTSRKLILEGRKNGVQLVVIDADGEYESIAKAMGVKVIKLNPASGGRFNPFEAYDGSVRAEILEGKAKVCQAKGHHRKAYKLLHKAKLERKRGKC
jgi:hypothetical protein